MKKNIIAISLTSFALIAGAIVLIQQVASNRNENITKDHSPTVTTAPGDCYFVWATRELPELTAIFQEAVRDIQPEAQARAQAYGEDCIYADGRTEFGALETDFYIRLPVARLDDEQVMGKWIEQLMPVLERIPPDQVPGPQPGFVEFNFVVSESEALFLRVSIDRYNHQARQLTGAELFRFFHENP